MYRPNLESLASSVPETAIKVLGGVAKPNLREEEAAGCRGWYRSKERW